MPVPMPTLPDHDPNGPDDKTVRDQGSIGTASLEALASIPRNGNTRLPGTGSGGTVTAPGYHAAENGDLLENPSSNQSLSKEEADRLYSENIEDEYAKREGGA